LNEVNAKRMTKCMFLDKSWPTTFD